MSLIYDQEGNRKYLTASERRAFLEAAGYMPDKKVGTLCKLLAYSGVRLSEALALTPRRIDVTARILLVESLKKRRRGVFRAVPIPPELIAELERVHDLTAARIDPKRIDVPLWPWCRTTGWLRIKECMALAGLEGTKASPKGLRHTFGVSALQSGVPINLVRKWLGHAKLATTEIYTDAVGEEEQALAGRFWETF